MKMALLLPAILLVVAAYDAVAQDSPDASDGLNIQASFYPYYEFTRAVASENDTVVQFLPAGVAAHRRLGAQHISCAVARGIRRLRIQRAGL